MIIVNERHRESRWLHSYSIGVCSLGLYRYRLTGLCFTGCVSDEGYVGFSVGISFLLCIDHLYSDNHRKEIAVWSDMKEVPRLGDLCSPVVLAHMGGAL